MILHTMMPHEQVFPTNEEAFAKQKVIEAHGVQLVVQPYSNDQWQIVRLLSSDPNDYLNGKYAPGQLIAMKPLLE